MKKILIAVVIIISIPLVAALFIKKEYKVVREITIDKPKQEVFDYILLLKNQDNYSKWAMMDPNSKKTYTGTDGAVGFISAWDSEMDMVGKGEQEIINIVENERIDYELRFEKPFEAVEPAFMSTESITENQTKVKWGFEGHMDYPMNIMLVFMNMEEIIGGDLDTGLQKLKEVLEK